MHCVFNINFKIKTGFNQLNLSNLYFPNISHILIRQLRLFVYLTMKYKTASFCLLL